MTCGYSVATAGGVARLGNSAVFIKRRSPRKTRKALKGRGRKRSAKYAKGREKRKEDFRGFRSAQRRSGAGWPQCAPSRGLFSPFASFRVFRGQFPAADISQAPAAGP